MLSNLEFRNGAFRGSLAGKPLNCSINASLPGSVPVAGLYQIQRPMEDAVWGLVAIMTPANQAAGAVSLAVATVGASASLFDKLVPSGSGPASFILSSRSIPGRNCLIVRNNFADLMDALKSAGGATVKIP
jgi:hypothetical protein